MDHQGSWKCSLTRTLLTILIPERMERTCKHLDCPTGAGKHLASMLWDPAQETCRWATWCSFLLQTDQHEDGRTPWKVENIIEHLGKKGPFCWNDQTWTTQLVCQNVLSPIKCTLLRWTPSEVLTISSSLRITCTCLETQSLLVPKVCRHCRVVTHWNQILPTDCL